MSAIVVEQLSKQFPREPRPAVDHVSFEVEDGAFVVLLGPSGCGKTTLLKMINRLYKPSGGRILVGGEEALRLADKIVIMREGMLVQYDTPLQIIMHPRDTFVRDLTGADDVLRRLSLLSVRASLAAGRNGNGIAATDSAPRSETVGSDDNLRDALAQLLRSGAQLLPVVGPNGEQLGQLSLDELRGIAQDKETRRQGEGERVS
jgi:ABC-type proline/glycine betaine transport system ATPase subunit